MLGCHCGRSPRGAPTALLQAELKVVGLSQRRIEDGEITELPRMLTMKESRSSVLEFMLLTLAINERTVVTCGK